MTQVEVSPNFVHVMRNSPPKYFCALLFCLLIVQVALGQLSKKHYIPPLTSAEYGNANPENQYIYISTPNNLNVNYTITPIGQVTSNIITGIVSNNNPDEIFIGTGNGQLFQPSNESSTVITNRGYIIEAEDVIYVSIRMRAGGGAQAGALVSKGIAALGTTFRAGSYTNQSPQSNYLNFVSFMATENNTTVTVDDLPVGLSIKNYTGTFPISISLNEGESYIVATNSNESIINRDGLIGTLIQSDKPIVVNSGSANGSFHNGNGRDYGIDQIVDFSNVGNEYIFVRGDGSNNFENVLIVAHEDNTDISVNGGAVIATINAGEWQLIEGDSYNANGNMYVNTSKNVFAYQGVGGNGNSEANQGMFFVPSLSCNNRGDLNSIANIQNIGNTIYSGGITIVTNKGANVEINGQPISDFTTSGPFDVDGNSNYVTYKVLGLNNNVSVLSTGELYCAYFNFNGAATSGSFYSGFPSSPEIDFNLDLTAAGNCIPNITLQAFNTDVFDTVEWYYDDGTGFIATGETNPTFKPLLPGGYKLVGTIVCSGLTLDSPSVRVSVCPDDFDGDSVIDNLDVDIDNDGILNCDESLGDVNLDLTNLNNPLLNFQDGSTNNSLATGSISTASSSGNTNTLTASSNGDFTSTVSSAITAEQSYRIDFLESVNIKFQETQGYTHSATSGETFSIIIGPSEQNITLVDPDNTILVDTDFDGIFETGITNFSTSEIRFRYNPTPNGPTPFQFVASKIDYVIFKHQLSNTTEQSSFQGNLNLTCFALDSDGDGNDDAFDLDSENDGIPDLLEASGIIISLSNSDSNFDGLDDVFNGIGVTPADTDLDGIPDYLDVDSDNDGIFDLFEANHSLPDINFDGIIDNAVNLTGNNGLVNALETFPDSFILNYLVANTDNDNLINATELDSDNDLCYDVFEAGFTDSDDDGILSGSPVSVNQNGKVLNAIDGYTNPGTNYVNYAPILLNTNFEDVEFCESSVSSITIDTNADSFQWQVSADGGINWEDITPDTKYSGVTTNTIQITNLPLSFNNYQYRVLLERNGNSCGSVSNSITLSVSPLPIVNSGTRLEACDTDTDGFSLFNLNDAQPLISTNYINETFSFHTSQSDAENNLNAIPTPSNYTNDSVSIDTVWVRTTSSFGCTTISSIELYVSTTELPNTFLLTFQECDDYLDIDGNDTNNNNDKDGISFFNFSSATTDILAAFPSNQQLEISYYRSDQDAQSKTNPITDLNNHRNIGHPTTQFIHVRIDDLVNNTCSAIGPYIELRIQVVPQINPALNIQICDDNIDGDNANGFVQNFNLDSRTASILAGQNPSLFTVSYHLSEEDARNNINAITNTSSFTNTVAYRQVIYTRITNTVTACFTGGRAFDLIIESPPISNPINDIIICDDNNDGSATNGIVQNINLDSYISQILGNQDPNRYQISFHTSQSDADSGNNPIISPFTNSTPFNQSIYVRNRNIITGCMNSSFSFNIIVNSEPTIEIISDIEICESSTNSIDINSLIPRLLGASQDPINFTVTFHSSSIDASTGNSPITNSLTIPSSLQTIYVRAINNLTGCINSSGTFNVVVNPLPILNPPQNLELCDDDTDGLVSGFDLESQTTTILNGLDPNLYTISYHSSLTDATSGVNNLTSPYTNVIANQQTIYVRGVNNITGCINTSISFQLIVNLLPTINPVNDLEICDDDSDGFVTNIDLDVQTISILGNQDPNLFTVTYHLSLSDAQNGVNNISSPFANTTAFNQTIYTRITNTITGCINSGAAFNIVVNPEPIVTLINDIEFCDDNTDGIVSNINLDNYIPSILNGLNPNQYTVTFHLSNTDVMSGDNPLSSPFTNTVTNQQTIFVRVLNNTTGCSNTDTFFDIIINPLPVLTTPSNIELCDDDADGIVDGFDLDSQTATILNGLDPNLYTISYHSQLIDARRGVNALVSPYSNTLENQQTIFVRGVNNATGCANTSISFEIIVNPLPVVTPIDDFILCDDGTAVVEQIGSTTDGIMPNINLQALTPQILEFLNPNDHSVSYHYSLTDAENNTNPITAPFTNTIAFSQPIYVRILNLTTQCRSTIYNFNLIINPIPEINTVEDFSFCDDDTDGDDTNGFIQNIDLGSQIPSILGPNQNTNDFEVTFYESLQDADNGENSLNSLYSNTIADTQPIYVRVLNNNTGCINTSLAFNIIVNPLPDFQVRTPQFICLNKDSLILDTESSAENYDYFWIDTDGNTILGKSITIVKGGIYYITATQIDGSGCSRTREVVVTESNLASITDEDVIIDDGDDDNSILINNNPGNLGLGNYEFALLDNDGNIVYHYQDEPFFGNLKGGIYTILVRDKNGCGEAELEVAVIELPKFFTPNSDGVNDHWNVKGVTKEFFPKSKISIFDRYGKFIADFTIDHPGWNGRYNGKVVFSNDYWARVELINKHGKVRVETRNFALLRR